MKEIWKDTDPFEIENEVEEKKIVYPEDLMDKKCGGCVRCVFADIRRDEEEPYFYCSMQSRKKHISPRDRACVQYWDREEKAERDRKREEKREKERKERWAVNSKKPPIKLPIVHDGYGMIPECPTCGEMPYSTEQCYFCGQRFIQDEEVEEYSKPLTVTEKCLVCGADVVCNVSRYNGHKSYRCSKCGTIMME